MREMLLAFVLSVVAAGTLHAQFWGGAGGSGGGTVTWNLCIGSPCAVGTNLTPLWISGQKQKVQKCYIVAKSGPTGADLVVDIVHSSDGSLFGAQKLRIVDGQTSGSQGDIATPQLHEGDTLAISITQVGSVAPGSNVTVMCKVR